MSNKLKDVKVIAMWQMIFIICSQEKKNTNHIKKRALEYKAKEKTDAELLFYENGILSKIELDIPLESRTESVEQSINMIYQCYARYDFVMLDIKSEVRKFDKLLFVYINHNGLLSGIQVDKRKYRLRKVILSRKGLRKIVSQNSQYNPNLYIEAFRLL